MDHKQNAWEHILRAQGVQQPSTEWHPKFDDINRADPLGPRYIGYSHDLDKLIDFLVGAARPRLGPEAIFHIRIPTVIQVAITKCHLQLVLRLQLRSKCVRSSLKSRII